MGRVFFTGDTHFGHANIVKPTFGTSRSGFAATIEEHDERLVDNWNAVVQRDDQVFHLGDFQYRCKPGPAAKIFARLNGNKHLIIGNHDDAATLALPWSSRPELIRTVSVDGRRLVLCHYGLRTWQELQRGALHLYGHSHGKLPGTRQSQDVGVDCFAFTPVTLEQVRLALGVNHDLAGVARPGNEGEFESGDDGS